MNSPSNDINLNSCAEQDVVSLISEFESEETKDDIEDVLVFRLDKVTGNLENRIKPKDNDSPCDSNPNPVVPKDISEHSYDQNKLQIVSNDPPKKSQVKKKQIDGKSIVVKKSKNGKCVKKLNISKPHSSTCSLFQVQSGNNGTSTKKVARKNNNATCTKKTARKNINVISTKKVASKNINATSTKKVKLINETSKKKVASKNIKKTFTKAVAGRIVNIKKFLCSLCGREYLNLKNLSRHFLLAHESNRVECENCPAVFYDRKNLESHNKLKHASIRMVKVYICSSKNCNAKFKQLDELKEHRREEHSPLHMCYVCDMLLGSTAKLLTHLRAHNVECHECDACTTDKESDGDECLHGIPETLQNFNEDTLQDFPDSILFPQDPQELPEDALQDIQDDMLEETLGDIPDSLEDIPKEVLQETLQDVPLEGPLEAFYMCGGCDAMFKSRKDMTEHVIVTHLIQF